MTHDPSTPPEVDFFTSPPEIPASPAPADSGLTCPLVVTALPSIDADEPPPAMRMKAWLKIGLRRFRIRAEWATDDQVAGIDPTDPRIIRKRMIDGGGITQGKGRAA